MIVGIKYCGGCNSNFDRAHLVKQLELDIDPKFNLTFAKEDVVYDILVVVNGCATKCAEYKHYKSKKTIILGSEDEYTSLLESFKNILLNNFI